MTLALINLCKCPCNTKRDYQMIFLWSSQIGLVTLCKGNNTD